MVADLDEFIGMPINGRSQIIRHHLRAQTDAQKWFVFTERDANPFRFHLHEILGVVGAHWPAKDNGACVVFQRVWQGIAEAWAAHVQRVAARSEPLTDVPGVRMQLMQDDHDGPALEVRGQSNSITGRRGATRAGISVEHLASRPSASAASQRWVALEDVAPSAA